VDLEETKCSICGQEFRLASVVAKASAEVWGWDLGPVCPACIGVLGRHAPDRFPSIEEYEDALRRYPEPIWASDEEADAELDSFGFDNAPDFWRVEAR
jgi:hypothetical protein